MAFDAPHIITALVTVAIVIFCVLFHYEGLRLYGRWLAAGLLPHRAKIAALIIGQFMLHITEIWIFAFGYVLLLQRPEYGSLAPSMLPGIGDHVYYSAVVYTTLGFGDIVPSGPIRFLTGMEAVSGLTLITWSASFTFLEMQRYWGRD
jgi:hypothetical protein